MIGLFLLLAAQSPDAVASAPEAAPAPAPARRVCHREPGSDTLVCAPAQQPGNYRLPRYGPPAPGANASRGNDVKLGAKATNRGSARRNRSMATVGIPF